MDLNTPLVAIIDDADYDEYQGPVADPTKCVAALLAAKEGPSIL